MRSWSIPIGRLFGVDVRIHLTFFLLPMFIFWTEYAAHQGNANGPHDLALAGIILACVGAHECGHMLAARRVGLIPKAVILLPLTGVAIYDESRVEKPVEKQVEKQSPPALLWRREIRLALVGPLVSLALACLSAAVVTASGKSLYRDFEPHACLSSRWRTHPSGVLLPHSRCIVRYPPLRFNQQCYRDGPDDRGAVQR